MTWLDRWFQIEDPSRGLLLRVALFATLAWDAWADIPHTARYGAGSFNVSHFPALDAVLGAPDRAVVLALTLLQVFLALRIMAGIATRPSLTLMSLSAAYLYFSSQLDSYQHHYLVVVILGVLAVGSWFDSSARPAGWVQALLRAQIGIVYAWAAIAKLSPEWLSGATLQLQIQPRWAKEALASIASRVGVEELSVYAAVAISVALVELLLAATFQLRRWWWLAFPVGLMFHAGVEVLDFRVGRFSWIMAALYILVLPPPILDRISAPLERLGQWELPNAPRLSWGLGALCALAWLGLPFPELRGLAAVVASLVLIDLLRRPDLRAASAQLALIIGLVVVVQSSDVPRDYYKYMGGDARRRGELPVAVDAYEKAVRADPLYFSGWVRLGDLYLQQGRPDAAALAYGRADELEPASDLVRERLDRVKSGPHLTED